MVTQTQHDLIRLLKSFGLDKETTVAIVGLAKTDENRAKMIQMIIELYRETGEVTEQDIQKIGLMLTGDRKKGSVSSTKVTYERINEPTPNGGAYSEIYYYNNAGEFVDKSVATRCVIRECAADDSLIRETWGICAPKERK